MPLKGKICFLSIDVEADFGQKQGPFKGVDNLESILDIFQKVGVPATFFTTGRVLERYSKEFKEYAKTYEIACHTFTHRFWNTLTQEEREKELDRFLGLYRAVFNSSPFGFRAPSHIIDSDGLVLLEAKGFLYDSSVVPHYPFFKRYRGYRGRSPRSPYHPSLKDYKKQGAMKILELPTAGQLGGVPLAGAWISRLPHSFHKALLTLKKPDFLTVSMHPWDALDFKGRTTRPERFLRNLEKLLTLLKEKNYQFLTGKQVFDKFQ